MGLLNARGSGLRTSKRASAKGLRAATPRTFTPRCSTDIDVSALVALVGDRPTCGTYDG